MKSDEITIDIPLLIGSNKKWSTMGPDPDWGLLADCIMDGNKDPDFSRRCIVRVTLIVPGSDADVVHGVPIPVDASQ